MVVGADGTTVEHSEIRWPEGGIVQADTYVPDNPFMLEPGTQSLYIVTRDPQAVWAQRWNIGLHQLYGRHPREGRQRTPRPQQPRPSP